MGRISRALVTGTVLAVIAGIIGIGALIGWQYWNRAQTTASENTRSVLAPLAAEQIPKIFGFEYKSVEQTSIEAYALLTPNYRHEFEDRSVKDIIPQARARELISQVNVVGSGVIEAQRNSGSVLVFMNRTITDKTTPERKPVYEGARIRVDYQKVDGKWLINYVQPV